MSSFNAMLALRRRTSSAWASFLGRPAYPGAPYLRSNVSWSIVILISCEWVANDD